MHLLIQIHCEDHKTGQNQKQKYVPESMIAFLMRMSLSQGYISPTLQKSRCTLISNELIWWFGNSHFSTLPISSVIVSLSNSVSLLEKYFGCFLVLLAKHMRS